MNTDDLTQMQLDARDRQIEDLETESLYFRRLASHWRDIAFQLISINKLHDEYYTKMLDGDDTGCK